MIIKCDVCGCEFDHNNAGSCDCGFGCGGANSKCPNCGFDVKLPPELRAQREKEKQENSIFTKIEKELEKIEKTNGA